MKTYKILHIAAHYGGGVGTIINAWINSDNQHNHKLTYLNNVPENNYGIYDLFDIDMIHDYDIVVCHVWNHPSLFELLVTKKIPECRMIGWSHMSGLHAPYIIFDKLVNYFDEFYYTSGVSKLIGIDKEVIWSTCDVKEFIDLPKIKHDTFNIGYVGTLDYCKLHPDFVKICSKINIPNVKFIIVGTGCDEQKIKKEIKELKIENKFEFVGKVDDIKPYLAKFDLFLYPLNEKHFGTCEQVLGEAMAAGLDCIVLNNPAENSIDNFNGEPIDLFEAIYNSYKKQEVNHYDYPDVKDIYSIEKTIKQWNNAFQQLMKMPKTMKQWEGGDNIFIESLGSYGGIFKDYIYDKLCGNFYDLNQFDIPNIKKLFSENRQWQSKNKGSINQYARYFPEDKYLQEWVKLL